MPFLHEAWHLSRFSNFPPIAISRGVPGEISQRGNPALTTWILGACSFVVVIVPMIIFWLRRVVGPAPRGRVGRRRWQLTRTFPRALPTRRSQSEPASHLWRSSQASGFNPRYSRFGIRRILVGPLIRYPSNIADTIDWRLCSREFQVRSAVHQLELLGIRECREVGDPENRA